MKTPPIIVPKRSTVRAGIGRDTFSIDMRNQSASDIRNLMADLMEHDIAEQIKAGSDITAFWVDGRPSTLQDGRKSVKRNMTAFFRTGLQVAQAMAMIERDLFAAISRLTEIRTGALSNPDNWVWKKTSNGKSQVVDKTSAGELHIGERIVLGTSPALDHSTVANQAVVNGKAAGFFGSAVRRARNSFKDLSIKVWFTGPGQFPGGELPNPQGKAYIIIRPRLSGKRGKRRR